MDSIRLVQFDIHGTNPLNTFKREPQPLDDKTLPWVIPNGSPFFAEPSLVEVYNQSGGRLIRNRDYWVEEEFAPFCEVTGRSICCFVRLHQDILNANKEIFIDYQSLGANFVPRNSLKQWIDEMQRGKVPVPWSKVFGVPETLPSSLHMHSIKTEISDWYELSYFFKFLTEVVKTTNTEVFDQTKEVGDEVFSRLKALRNENMARMKLHDSNYNNPHGITAALLLLGNVPNYRAATLAEDLAGVRTDVLSTPLGVQEYVKSFIPDTSGIMLSGVLPISKFGGNSYIPPNISGSYEGLGGVSETAAIQFEANGDLVLLWNRQDGRTKGLYYSVAENYRDFTKAPDINYTAYKYEHPWLTSIGIDPDTIAPGSGKDVILVGESAKNRWFIGLAGGTLNAAAHVYSEIDLNLFRPFLSRTPANVVMANYIDKLSPVLMGEWIYLILSSQDCVEDSNYTFPGGYRYKFFARFKASEIGKGTTITPTLVTLNFQDADGVVWNNSRYFRWHEIVGSQTAVTKALFSYAPHVAKGLAGLYRSMITLSAADPTRPGIFAVKFLSAFWSTGGDSGRSLNQAAELNYDFNVETNTLVLKSKSPTPVIDWNLPALSTEFVQTASWMAAMVFNNNAQGMEVFSNGATITSTGSLGSFPRGARAMIQRNQKTRHQVINELWYNYYAGSSDILTAHGVTEPLVSPIESSINPRAPTFGDGGEYYTAARKSDPYILGFYFKEVSGKFALRPDITNLTAGNLYSRPLSNNVKRVNVNAGMPSAGVVVPSSKLDQFGVDVGDMAFCAGFPESHFKKNWDEAYSINLPDEWGDKGTRNDIYLYPKHTKRVESNGTVTIVPTQKIFYPHAIIEALSNEVSNVAVKNTGYIPSVCDPSLTLGEKYGWLPVLVNFCYRNKDTGEFLTTILSIEPTYADRPYGKEVTGFTVLDKAHHNRVQSSMYDIRTFGQSGGSAQSTHSALKVGYYLDGDSLAIHFDTGVVSSNVGDTLGFKFTLTYNNRNTKRWTAQTFSPQGSNAALHCCVPDDGIVESYRWGLVSGGVATIARKLEGTSGRNYLVSSAYPETGWVLFLPERIKALINGTVYQVPGGIIDLRDIDQSPNNKTFYLYITVEDDKISYLLSLNKLRKNNALLMVAVITTNDKQILTIERKQPFMIGDFMLGYTREGGIIPVSTGLPQEEGVFAFVKESELIP